MKKIPNLRYGISSHVSSEAYALPKLLDGMTKINKIKKSEILVVIGGAKENKTVIKDQIEYHYVTHNSYDHTAMIEILENNILSDWWFCMHDTCEVGPEFQNKIHDFGSQYQHVAMDAYGWLNMGLFSYNFLIDCQSFILSMKNCSKLRAILSERVFSRLTTHSHSSYSGYESHISPLRDVYGNNQLRRTLYFPELDLYKHQSELAWNVVQSSLFNPD